MSRFAPGWTFRETCCDSGSSLGTVGCVLAVVILTRLVRMVPLVCARTVTRLKEAHS